MKCGTEWEWQIRERRKTIFQFPLRIKFHGQFRENNGIIRHRSLRGRALDLAAGPQKPVRILCENVGNDAGLDQDHPRVNFSHSLVRPLTLPPRSNVARTRLPRDFVGALTTNTPSGRSINTTSASDRKPCFRRIARGIVTCPICVIFTATVSSRNEGPVNSFWGPAPIHRARLKPAASMPDFREEEDFADYFGFTLKSVF